MVGMVERASPEGGGMGLVFWVAVSEHFTCSPFVTSSEISSFPSVA